MPLELPSMLITSKSRVKVSMQGNSLTWTQPSYSFINGIYMKAAFKQVYSVA